MSTWLLLFIANNIANNEDTQRKKFVQLSETSLSNGIYARY